ncbi:septation ring formation regulator EzrA [Aneurinibacillus terranovensis]|uniref:septation ring formation regulator EzrA n=1 Tax=Aneurinibacillus terranovensis TaxID=278991 RepID=UPI001B7F9BA8
MILLSFALLTSSLQVWAADLPQSIDKPITDPGGIIKKQQAQQLTKLFTAGPQVYKLVAVKNTNPQTLEEYAKSVSDTFKIDPNTMVMILSVDDKTMAIISGSYFAKNGITRDVINRKIDLFFNPYAKEDAFTTGVSTFVKEINNEIKTYQQKKASGQIVSNTAQTEAAPAQSTAAASNGQWPLWFIIGFAILLIAIVVVVWAYFRRSLLLKEVDEVDTWRGKLLDELNAFDVGTEWKKESTKVRERYLDILTSLDDLKKDAIADVELILVDAEETIGKFRFRRGREIIQEAKARLQRIEDSYFQLGRRANKLTETLKDIETLKGEVGQQRQKIERRLDELRIQFNASFHSMKDRLNQFIKEEQEIKESQENGNFEETKTKLQKLHEEQKSLFEAVQKVSLLRQTIEKDLDQEIRQLDEDYREMLQEGYTDGEEFFAGKLVKIRGEADKLPKLFEDGKVAETEQVIVKVREEIESVYQAMEEIVTSRHQYQRFLQELPYQLSVLREDKSYLMSELADLAERYQVEDGEAFHYSQQIPEVIAEIEHALEQVALTEEAERYKRNRETLAQAAERANSMIERREVVLNELKEFRAGELAARESLTKLRSDVARVEQQLKRLHLPGIPESVLNSSRISRQALATVEHGLEEIPLNMQKVEHFLKEATEQVIQLLENATNTIRFSNEAEEMIQRTNRFRRYDKEIANLLSQAEQAFRRGEYEEAYQLARKASDIAAERFE